MERLARLPNLQTERLKRENSELRNALHDAVSKRILDQRYQEFMAEVAAIPPPEKRWVLDARPHRAKCGVPVIHLSDAHFDEVVDPAQVGGLNGYNRAIAQSRLRRFFTKSIMLCDDYLKGVSYPGIVMPVSGDLFSGNIHDELRETNEAVLCESLRYWLDPMYAGISMLAERFGKVYIPWVVGNHPRLTKKPRKKGGVHDNFDWLLGVLLQRDFQRAGDKRVTFEVSESFDLSFKIQNTRYLQTHGDQFRGGSGISGALAPWFIGDARKRERHQATEDPYDVLIMGHWHWRAPLPTIKANGSLKGYDEFALGTPSCRYQEPMQSFWINTPEHGITFEAPIYVAGKNEAWRKAAA
jgi:hypothetical protein